MPAPFVLSSDLVSAYPAKSVTLADYIDTSLAAKTDTAMVQNAQTGVSYSFALADASKLLTTSNASAVSVTVTKQATVTWVTGTQLRVLNLGAGVTTLVADTGVTINNNKALAQYQGGTLIRTASDVWTLVPNGAGKVLQVISTNKKDTFTVSAASASTTDVTGLSASITPSSTGSTILATWSVSGYAANVGFATVLKRAGTAIGIGDAAGTRGRVTDFGVISTGLTDGNHVSTGHFLDSPASTSSLTYQIALFNQRSSTQVLNVNLTGNDSDLTYIARASSSLTLMEIA